MKIAILDSGIDHNHSMFKKLNIENYIYEEETKIWIAKEIKIKNGHGTAVASVLTKYAKQIDEIYSFRVVEETDADIEKLINALEYIYAFMDCDLINISMGVREYSKRLEEICNKLYDKKVMIISAYANEGCVSYPAAFDGVIGIDSTVNLKKFNEYIWVKNSIVNVGCLKGVQRVAWLDGGYQLAVGNSFVAPIITAKISNWICQGVKIENIKKVLEENAIRVISGNSVENKKVKKEFSVSKVALFPYNKEIKNILKFSDMLNFEICAICDSKYSGNVGLQEGNLLVEDIDKYSFKDIDGFVLGHTDILELKTNHKYKESIISNCNRFGINIISFDDIEIEMATNAYVPKIKRDKYTTDKFGKLYDIVSPILAVVGTDSQQGKFTLQMTLRKKFLETGYQVGQLSSEPEGCVFDVDYVYPYGYNSTVYLQGRDSIEHVNALMHQIDIKEPDIILTGAQSGICTLSFENTDMYNLPTIEFLMGVNPDAVVMCINYHDDVDDILRTVKFTESLMDCKVIALSLFPLDYLNEWKYLRNIKEKMDTVELKNRVKEIEKITSIPTFILGDNMEENKMFEVIIDYFGS